MSLWTCLFWTFPINGITPCVSFCVRLLSHGRECQSFTPFRAWLSDVPVCGGTHLSHDGHSGWVHLLSAVHLVPVNIWVRYLCGLVFIFLEWNSYDGIAGHTVTLFLPFGGTATVIHSSCTISPPTSCGQGFQPPHTLAHTCNCRGDIGRPRGPEGTAVWTVVILVGGW